MGDVEVDALSSNNFLVASDVNEGLEWSDGGVTLQEEGDAGGGGIEAIVGVIMEGVRRIEGSETITGVEGTVNCSGRLWIFFLCLIKFDLEDTFNPHTSHSSGFWVSLSGFLKQTLWWFFRLAGKTSRGQNLHLHFLEKGSSPSIQTPTWV